MSAVPRWVWFVGGGTILVVVGVALRKFIGRALGGGALVQGHITAVSPFGPRGDHYHQGVDLFAAEGTPVAAAALGTVEMIGPSGRGGGYKMTGYGEYVVLRHAGGLRTLYAHLSKYNVSRGDRVSQGQIIGEVGRTAYGECGIYFCTDPAHLHFEVMPNEGPINRNLVRSEPVAWLQEHGLRPAIV